MPDGKNAGRLFPDCTNEHGHGEYHSFAKKPQPGETATCTVCGTQFVVEPNGKLAKVAWAVAPDFAEVAEVLKLPTDHIMGMHEKGGEFLVLYTPVLDDALDDDPDVYSVTLKRDADGILVAFGQPELRPGMWAEIRQRMEGLGG